MLPHNHMAKKRKPFISFKKVNFHRLSIGICLLFLGGLVVIRGVDSYQAQKALSGGAVNAAAFENNSTKNTTKRNLPE